MTSGSAVLVRLSAASALTSTAATEGPDLTPLSNGSPPVAVAELVRMPSSMLAWVTVQVSVQVVVAAGANVVVGQVT